MKSARDAGGAINAYREEVRKTTMAYREEVGEIIQEIPRQIFAQLVELTPNAREAVLSAICNGRAFSRSWRAAPPVEESNLDAELDGAYIEELKAVLAAAEGAGGAPPKRGTEGEHASGKAPAPRPAGLSSALSSP